MSEALLADASQASMRQLFHLQHSDISRLPLGIGYSYLVYLLVSRHFRRFKQFAKDHPYQFILIVLGLTTFVGSLCILPILGFGAAGPVAGSIAAGWQSSIGLVSAGSFFAFLQSAGMGGAALMGVTGIGLGGVAVAGIAAAGEDTMDRVTEIGSTVVEGLVAAGEGVSRFAKKLWVVGTKKKS